MAVRSHEAPLTAETFAELPDNGLKEELVSGWIVSEAVPGGAHGRVMVTLGSLLHQFVRMHLLGVVYCGNSGFVLSRSPDTVRGPDISFLRMTRVQHLDNKRGYIPGPPDLAIEIISPSDRPNDVHAKVGDYLAAGCTLAWVIDPDARQVWVFRSLLSPVILTESDTLEGEDVLPGFSIPVRAAFEV